MKRLNDDIDKKGLAKLKTKLDAARYNSLVDERDGILKMIEQYNGKVYVDEFSQKKYALLMMDMDRFYYRLLKMTDDMARPGKRKSLGTSARDRLLKNMRHMATYSYRKDERLRAISDLEKNFDWETALSLYQAQRDMTR